MTRKPLKIAGLYSVLVMIFFNLGYAETPSRVGTTAASFLEYGYGAIGCSMGDACVSMVNDLSSIYWNPAGLAFMERSEVMLFYQPWLVDIATSLTAVGLVLPNVGTLSVGILVADNGKMEVTTVEMPEGTGEEFSARDYTLSLAYGRNLTTWFAFGAAGKYISSTAWHENANALAVDLGVIIKTSFFSPSGSREQGMNIGMSISNYGTRMQYEGMDLLQPIDILPDESGNYRDVQGEFKTQGWELPLIFRVGFSVNPIVTNNQKVTLSVDALHPNNNNESVNLGLQYIWSIPNFGSFSLRSGYKALFLENSEYGLSFGGGFTKLLLGNKSFGINIGYRKLGMLGDIKCYNMSFSF
jgi:hypothetical protein